MNISKVVIKALHSLKTGEKGKLVNNLLFLIVSMRRISDCGFIVLDYDPEKKNDEFYKLHRVLAKDSKFYMSVFTLADVYNFGIECGFLRVLKTKKKKGNLMRVMFSVNSTRDNSNYIKVDVDKNTTKTGLMYSISKILILDKIERVQRKAESVARKADGSKKTKDAKAKNCPPEKFMMEYNVISYDTFASLVFVGRNKVIQILNNFCLGQHPIIEKTVNKFDVSGLLAKDYLFIGNDIYKKFIQKANGEGFFIQIANKWELTGEGERYLRDHSRNYHRKSPMHKRYGHMVVKIQAESKDKRSDELFKLIARFNAKLTKRRMKLKAYIKLPVNYMQKDSNITKYNRWGVKYYQEGILAEKETDNLLNGWNVTDEQKELFKTRVEEIKMSYDDSYRIKDVLVEVGIDIVEAEKQFIAKNISPIERKICNDYRDIVNLPLKNL